MLKRINRKKLFFFLLLFPILAIIILLGAVYIISPSDAGKELAESKNIPFKAVLAHRGASYYAPEATAPSYILATKMEVDYIEIDMRRTKDGVLIAFHDRNMKKTTNAKDIYPGRESSDIGTFTFAELQKLDVGSWFNSMYPKRARKSYKGLKLLTLDDIVTIAEKGRNVPGLYIEAKSPDQYPGIEKQILRTLEKRGWIVSDKLAPKRRIIFQSFDMKSVKRFHKLAPNIPRCQLISKSMAEKYGFEKLVRQSQNVATGIGASGYLGSPWNIRKIHKFGLIVHFYTIDSVKNMRILSFSGADGVFTNRCDIAMKFFKGKKYDVQKLLRDIKY